MYKSKRILLYVLLLLLSTIILGCDPSSKNSAAIQSEFDCFTNNIFKNEVTSDSITLNYTLSKPEKYEISKITPTLGNYGLYSMKENLASSENYLSTLKDFPYKQLTKEQQLTYDILVFSIKLEQNASDLFLYAESISPTTGIQAQLPILLAEYKFYKKEDIDQYLLLLQCVNDYFEDIILFEKQKSKHGLFMCDKAVDDIIAQCKTFISDKENNLLIHIFNDKVTTYHGLTEKEVNNYIQKNKEIILTNVIPAYQNLINGLSALKGSGVNDGGLCNFKHGKDYYEYLVASTTGSSKSIKEIDSLLDTSINDNLIQMSSIIKKNPNIFDQATSLSYPHTDPVETIDYLKSAILQDFPPLEEVNCTIKYVDKSLEENLSPAFYLTPAIDCYDENSIYINRSDSYDLSSIFTTLAHEGYPGHLYQTIFYNQQNPNPIRNILDFGGYSEGWATYVELYSFGLAEIDKNVAQLLESNLITTLDMYAKIDIGVNYYKWDMKDTADFLSKFGMKGKDTIESVYFSVIEEPGNYLKYTLGYLEIVELRDKSKRELGERFVLKDFHQFLLKIGPAPFHIINSRLDNWIITKK